MTKRTRVLVVDDSAFMRKLITEIISSDPGCEVIKTAEDGVEALKAVEKLKPDVVTLDIELPEIDGLTVLAYIMEDFPTPVVMISGFSSFLGEQTIKALEYGAVGFIRKPDGPVSRNIGDIRQELLSQIKIASQVDMRKLTPLTRKESKGKEVKPIPTATNKIVVIAASSGGPRALGRLIPELPADLPAAVLVIQHMPDEFIPPFAKRLNWESRLEVKVAGDSEQIQQGKVLVLPSDLHCKIQSKGAEGELIKLAPASPKDKNRLISADEAMVSLAPIYGRNATGVVLTGMGNDGTEGLRTIKKYGGYTIAEHESTCIVYGMPGSAIKADVIDKVIPLDRIADEIVKAVCG